MLDRHFKMSIILASFVYFMTDYVIVTSLSLSLSLSLFLSATM
jgi:hypothetical protein